MNREEAGLVQAVREKLQEEAEENYRIFQAGLLPGVNNLLGVRLGTLRKIARTIAVKSPYAYLAAAWAISSCYIRFREKTERFLEEQRLDEFTRSRAIRKIRESRCVSREEKAALAQRYSVTDCGRKALQESQKGVN